MPRVLNISIFAMDRFIASRFKEVFAVRHLGRCWVRWPKAQTLWVQLSKFKAHNLASTHILHRTVSVKPQFHPNNRHMGDHFLFVFKCGCPVGRRQVGGLTYGWNICECFTLKWVSFHDRESSFAATCPQNYFWFFPSSCARSHDCH